MARDAGKMEEDREFRNYVDRLLPEARARYVRKIFDIDGIDPYEIPERSWSSNPVDLPEVNYISFVNYFYLEKSAYTREELRAYKSLQAYKAFVAGWVQEIQSYRPGGCDNVVVSAKVLHLQHDNDKELAPWLIASVDGNILSAHCTCTAGFGEACTHVAALTFAVDAVTQTKERATCTCSGVKAYWKEPQGSEDVAPMPGFKIDFLSAEAKKDLREKLIGDDMEVQKPLPRVPTPTAAEMNSFFQQLKDISKDTSDVPVLLTVLPGFCEDFKVDPQAHVPNSDQP